MNRIKVIWVRFVGSKYGGYDILIHINAIKMKKWTKHLSSENIIWRDDRYTNGKLLQINKNKIIWTKRWSMLGLLISIFVDYLLMVYCMLDGGRFFFHPMVFFLWRELCGGRTFCKCTYNFSLLGKFKYCIYGHACKPQNTMLTILLMAVLSSQVSE